MTVRVDSSWGVSGFDPTPRKRSPYLPYDVQRPSHGDRSAYERCKVTRRCPRAKEHFNVNANSKRFTHQIFDGGRHFEGEHSGHLPAQKPPPHSHSYSHSHSTPSSSSLSSSSSLVVSEDDVLAATTLHAGWFHGIASASGVYGGRGGFKSGSTTSSSSAGQGVWSAAEDFSGGRVGLFADFEDWRVGTHGWRQRGGQPPAALPAAADAYASPSFFNGGGGDDAADGDDSSGTRGDGSGSGAGSSDYVGAGGYSGVSGGSAANKRHGHNGFGPNGAHFSPFSFPVLGPSVPIPPPPGRKADTGRGAQRQAEDGSSTDSHLSYRDLSLEPPPLLSDASRRSALDYSVEQAQARPAGLPPSSPYFNSSGNGAGSDAAAAAADDEGRVDFDRFQNRGLVLNNRTFGRDLQSQRRLIATLQEDRNWHEAHRQTALLDAQLRSRLDVDRFMTKVNE